MAAEWDASTLREKYGEPLAPETFLVLREGQYPLSPALRGQRILSLPATTVSRIFSSSVEYEIANIAEHQDNGRRTAVTITFNRPEYY